MSDGDLGMHSANDWDFPNASGHDNIGLDADCGHHAPLEWPRFIPWLPRLGTVLWLHRCSQHDLFPRARLLPHSLLLLDHPALSLLADSVIVTSHTEVITRGPREWIEFHNCVGDSIAKLYLLPDTDYLAWDGMLENCSFGKTTSALQRPRYAHKHASCATLHLCPLWQSHIARFPLLRLPCLQLLGLRKPEHISPIGRVMAQAISADEHATIDEDMTG